MSEQTTPEMPTATKPVEEHKWLQQFVGNWNVVTEMWMDPSEPPMTGQGTESVTSLGGLWTVAEVKGAMPDGTPTRGFTVFGYDVSFNEYRGCFYGDMSSHLWKYTCTLSDDKKSLICDCVGPDMVNEGQTANYRDVYTFEDANKRTLTSYGEDANGEWQMFMKSTYTRT
ncbi:MAG: DUF1579 domain-containing protein [Fimbriimonadaceae bacterium]|nr:DUF1579 domain-containing protein [Fimbriimonadaceae bacterium]